MTAQRGALLAGRYRLHEPLGRGAMAEVWAADDLAGPQPIEVAVKLLGEVEDEDDRIARFEREARAVARIEHPNVCRLYDAGREGDTAFLVLERLHGETLAERLEREQTLSLRELEPIAGSMLDGLSAAHAVGVVHRDLKPSNVFLAERPVPGVKLLDFGVSKIVASDPMGFEPSLTTEHTTVGSLAFMAPEQVGASTKVDGRADLYAVGVVACRALTGRLPFAAHSLEALITLKMDHEAPTLDELTGLAWPPALAGFFRRALARDPAGRFADAAVMRAALSDAVASTQGAELPRSSQLGAPVADASPTETLPLPRGGRRRG